VRPIRVIVVDDHRLLREAIAELVASEQGYEVVASVDRVAAVEPHLPGVDVVLLDLSLPGGGALELVERLRATTATRAIIVSMYQSPEYVRAAIAAGASGYVFKQSTEQHLLDAIQHALAGRVYVDPSMADAIGAPDIVTSSRTPTLTERERAVLLLLARGLAYRAIAEQLGIGARTVETYRRRVTEKLGLRTRADLLRYATELGWLAAPPSDRGGGDVGP
jgi:DNA-binding NarL/FixJ family response regulator